MYNWNFLVINIRSVARGGHARMSPRRGWRRKFEK